jgi:hypothetical protein
MRSGLRCNFPAKAIVFDDGSAGPGMPEIPDNLQNVNR